jgi:uncharacterized membrane protein YtjA (UPF0391 family)
VSGSTTPRFWGWYSIRTVLNQEPVMLRWAFIFLVLALVAAVFGFGGIASTAAGIAKVLFFIAIAVFLVMLMLGLVGARKVTSIR